MKDRIKEVRKKNGLTQVEFGEKIGVKGNTVTGYETGLRNPTDAVVLSICREFNVREEWLRDGVEPIYKSRTRNQEIGAFMNDVMDLPDEAFKKRLIDALRKLDEKDWEAIERIADKVLKEG
ncbi:MAG: helix-turn-helix transcriptional regulator [Lachnospiraceae bacterium]|nr:helix-turn-helix transcriptional regulator [Lachnospiraceae bacterium]